MDYSRKVSDAWNRVTDAQIARRLTWIGEKMRIFMGANEHFTPSVTATIPDQNPISLTLFPSHFSFSLSLSPCVLSREGEATTIKGEDE